MAFRTKLDFSNNRQVKQFEKTQTVLSGGTSFGLTFSALTSGPDPITSGETNNVSFIASTFSGNSATTVYNWYDPAMSLAEPYFSALTPSISAITQSVDAVFTAETTTVIDGNTVALSYSGVGFDITPIAMYDLGGGAYSGTVETADLNYYSATTLDYTGRTIWVDVSGITRTERLIVTNEAQVGSVLTCIDNEGMAEWQAPQGYFSGNYATLNTLVTNNELIPGNKYILTDYQTVYQINGSDSRNRIQEHEIIGSSGLYSQFNNVPSNIAANGDTVVCVFAPSGASVTTGSTFTIIDYFNFAYIRLSPTITGVNNIGVKLKFEKQRYFNVPSGATINDINGKPVFKSGGVLNTEVHDDSPYMSMTSGENPSPIVESLVLTALDNSSFSIFAESLTFAGDKLEYDFTDTEIYDDNIPPNLIGTRNGNILKRENSDSSISANVDWRVQRYRRFQMDNNNWNNYLYNKLSGGTSATTASTIYNRGSVNYCTNNNPTITTNHRYVMYEPYYDNLYIDFAKTVPDPFISGVTTGTAPVLQNGVRLPTVFNETAYSVDVTLPLSGFTGTSLIKDFNIIPIVNYEADTNVDGFVVNNLYNSVFLPYSQRYGNTFNLNVNSVNGTITNSTFMSLPNINNSSIMDNIVGVDNVIIDNRNQMYQLNLLANGDIKNNGVLRNCSFGLGYSGPGVNENFDYTISDDSIVVNSVFGANRLDSVLLNGLMMNSSLIIHRIMGACSMSGSMFLTRIKNSGDTYGVSYNLKSFSNRIPSKTDFGYIYDFNRTFNDETVYNDTQDKRLIYNVITTGLTFSAVTVSTAQ
jgi:hypothetical protein